MTEASREARADALLDAVREERQRRLKIFLGAAPGVGKTWAMLSAARELAKQGVDVAVGIVETHGRVETAALLEGLEVLPRLQVNHRGRNFEEFDLDAALVRKPAVLLVDELAHTNLPGGRHERRWQDIVELLDAGISKASTTRCGGSRVWPCANAFPTPFSTGRATSCWWICRRAN